MLQAFDLFEYFLPEADAMVALDDTVFWILFHNPLVKIHRYYFLKFLTFD